MGNSRNIATGRNGKLATERRSRKNPPERAQPCKLKTPKARIYLPTLPRTRTQRAPKPQPKLSTPVCLSSDGRKEKCWKWHSLNVRNIAEALHTANVAPHQAHGLGIERLSGVKVVGRVRQAVLVADVGDGIETLLEGSAESVAVTTELLEIGELSRGEWSGPILQKN